MKTKEEKSAYNKLWRQNNPNYDREWKHKNIEKGRIYARKYYWRNREKCIDSAMERYNWDKEKVRRKDPNVIERMKKAHIKYRNSNPEKIKETNKKSRIKNAEKIAKKAHERWIRNHPNAMALYRQKKQRNAEKCKEGKRVYGKKYRIKNADKEKEKVNRWQNTDKGLKCVIKQNLIKSGFPKETITDDLLEIKLYTIKMLRKCQTK